MSKILDVRSCDFAPDLALALLETTRDLRQQDADAAKGIYVKTPDGKVVVGYKVERERLTDGSMVFNILLAAD